MGADTSWTRIAGTVVACGIAIAVAIAPVRGSALGPTLSVEPPEGQTNTPFDAHAAGFLPGELLTYRWDGVPMESFGGERTQAGPGGLDDTTFLVPSRAVPGEHEVRVTGSHGSSAATSFTVIPRSSAPPYRLPTSTTTPPETTTTAAPSPDPVATATPPTPDRATATTSTTPRDQRDVPDTGTLELASAPPGGPSDGPPTWMAGIIPIGIVAVVGGRFLARLLTATPDDE